MTPDQLIKGDIYYMCSKTSGRAYIFKFLTISNGLLVSSSDRSLVPSSPAFYSQNVLIGVSFIDKLRPASLVEMQYLNNKLTYEELMCLQTNSLSKSKKFSIKRNLKISFKL